MAPVTRSVPDLGLEAPTRSLVEDDVERVTHHAVSLLLGLGTHHISILSYQIVCYLPGQIAYDLLHYIGCITRHIKSVHTGNRYKC